MWQVTYVITPDRGYFDSGERVLYDAGIRLTAIRALEFMGDGSIVILYEVDGDVDLLRECLDVPSEKVVDYEITRTGDPLLVQIRFHPDEGLRRIFEIQRSYGVSIEFPIEYVGHDPFRVKLTEVGPHEELRKRIETTREFATVYIKHLREYEPSTDQLFGELTDRQQEVLRIAFERGYYETPRQVTHDDIAAELDCSASMVGQHLRRIEQQVMAAIVPKEAENRRLLDSE